MKNKILIVDDIIENIEILVEVLKNRYELFVATDWKGVQSVLENTNIDLILLDIMIPEIDGYQICQKLKKDSKFKNIPIVFITAKVDERSIEKAYEVGGVDYITKPLKMKEVLCRVKIHLDFQNTIKELEKTKNELEKLASKDFLTNIYNRRSFENIGQKLLEKVKKYNQVLSMIIFDIDYYKEINDTYGHLIGDKILISLVNIVNKLIEEKDVFVRFGGDEFILLLPNTDLEKAKSLGNKIIELITKTEFDFENLKIKITVSMGIAEYNEDEDLNKFIDRVDKLLYKAKTNGRNRIEID